MTSFRNAGRCFAIVQCVTVLLMLADVLPASRLKAQMASGRGAAEIAQGMQQLRSGDVSGAKASFDAAVKADPRSAEALTWRGICEDQMGQFKLAAVDLRSALRLDTSLLSAHYNLALTLIRLKDTDAAIEQLKIVVATQPQAVPARYNLAVLLEGKSFWREAIAQLTEAHALAPEDAGVTLHLLADRLKMHDDTDRGALVEALSAASTAPAMQRDAGAALLEAGAFGAAAKLLEMSRVREPSADVDVLLARSYLGDQQGARAAALLESGGAANDEERTYLLALAYNAAGDVRKAAVTFEAAAKMDPKDGRPLYHLGLLAALAPKGQAAALQLLRGAVQLDPGNVSFSLALARVLLATDKAEEAKVLLRKLPRDDANETERSMLLGIALASTNEVAEAVPLLKKALLRDAKLAMAENVLGFCLFRQGEYAAAAEAYRRASEMEPTRLRYVEDAALAYQRASDNEQALQFAARAVALSDSNASDHALLGKLYAGAGKKQEAVVELRRAVELNPELDSAYYLLARTYLTMGDKQQAAEWSAKLGALKQKHEAAFIESKKAQPASIRSSTLLEGGSLADEDQVPQ